MRAMVALALLVVACGDQAEFEDETACIYVVEAQREMLLRCGADPRPSFSDCSTIKVSTATPEKVSQCLTDLDEHCWTQSCGPTSCRLFAWVVYDYPEEPITPTPVVGGTERPADAECFPD